MHRHSFVKIGKSYLRKTDTFVIAPLFFSAKALF